MAGLKTYNLAGIRSAIFAQADWAPSNSPVAKDRVDQFINRAYFRMSEEAPFLFFESEIRMAIDPDVNKASSTDLLRVAATLGAGDAWVLETELNVGAVGSTTWNSDRLWDGRTIQLYDDDQKRWIKYKIREVWEHANRYRLSLDRPWKNTTDTGIDWFVETHEFNIPQDAIEVRSLTLKRSNSAYPLSILGQDSAEWSSVANSGRIVSKGLPRWAFRREHKSLRAPTFDPVASTTVAPALWVGPEPTGKFEYRFTYIWGKQEIWFHNPGPQTQATQIASESRYQPYLESPPSPQTAQVDNTADLGAGTYGQIQITLPNIDFMLGFEPAALPRLNHAGIKKRIYRRRISEGPTLGVPAGRSIEQPDDFFLIAEVDGHITTYTDTGENTPDYGVPLQPVHGYQTVRLWPTPNANYTVEIRCIRRPKALTDEQDYPLINEDAMDCLITRALAYLYESQGNAAMAQYSLTSYQESLFLLGKRYGDLRSKSRPRRKRTARVTRNINLRRLLTTSEG
tara:strand:+ start:303 stop:1838 length:1536 start_codon:yes stop_codon:yes gene_type:complete